jgi:type IV secretion system protein VirB1
MLDAALLACAIGVAPTTMDAIVRIESGGNPLAVHVNKLAGPQPRAETVQDAVAVTQRYIALGYSVDMGWAQLNSRNLDMLGYSVADAFDGCKNLAAGAHVLSGFYAQAVSQFGEGQRALMAALSGYNTGSLVRGFENGYVARYTINAALPVESARPPAQTSMKPKTSLPRFETVAYDRPGYSMVIQ